MYLKQCEILFYFVKKEEIKRKKLYLTLSYFIILLLEQQIRNAPTLSIVFTHYICLKLQLFYCRTLSIHNLHKPVFFSFFKLWVFSKFIGHKLLCITYHFWTDFKFTSCRVQSSSSSDLIRNQYTDLPP